MLEEEVDTLQQKLSESADAIVIGDVQEAQLHAEDIASMLPDDDEAFIGGRARGAVEALKQLQLARKAKHERHIIELPKFSSFVKTITLWLGVTIIAMYLWMKIGNMIPPEWDFLPFSGTLLHALAWAFLVLSVLVLSYEFTTLFPKGQEALDHFKHYLKSVYVGLLVVIISCLYIPITKQALSVFLCFTRQCNSGTWYPHSSPMTSAGTLLDATKNLGSLTQLREQAGLAGTCQTCSFLSGPEFDSLLGTHTCPPELASALCAGDTTSRLKESPDMSCDEMWPYYIPGSFLTLTCFTFGTLWLFYELVRQHTKRYASLKVIDGPANGRASAVKGARASQQCDSHFHGSSQSNGVIGSRVSNVAGRMSVAGKQLIALTEWDQMDEEEQNEVWVRRVRPSKRNKARSLYCDFKYRWRYWKLILLLQKLLLVVCLAMTQAHGSPVTTAISVGVVHLSMLILNIRARPYMDYRPDLLSITISMANVFNAIIGVLTLARVEMAHWWIYIICCVNFGLPIVALIAGWRMNKTRKKRRKEEGKLVGKPIDSGKMAKQRRLVERNINEYTLRFLVSWTSVVVVCSCLAAELIFIGQFENLVLSPVWSHTTPDMITPSMEFCAREDEIRRLEFVGFNSWRSFTENCCCMPRATMDNSSSGPDQMVELWMCRNTSLIATGVSYKERQRRSLDSMMSDSLVVRPFCGTFFQDSDGNQLPGVEPYWNSQSERLQVGSLFPNGSAIRIWDEYW